MLPHAATGRPCTRRLDIDHPVPYVPPARGGPPGQTGDHNAAPLSRRNPRAETHLGYQVRRIGLDQYLWQTPHGLHRLVDPAGTTDLDEAAASHLAHADALDRVLSRVEAELASGH